MSESGEPQVRLRVKLDISQDGLLRGATGPEGPSEMTGSLKGSTVELFWDTDFEGTPVAFRFTGTATGDDMSGSVVNRFWRARRRLREQLDPQQELDLWRRCLNDLCSPRDRRAPVGDLATGGLSPGAPGRRDRRSRRLD